MGEERKTSQGDHFRKKSPSSLVSLVPKCFHVQPYTLNYLKYVLGRRRLCTVKTICLFQSPFALPVTETCFTVHMTLMCIYSRVKQNAINRVVKEIQGRGGSLLGSPTGATSNLISLEMAGNSSNGQIGYNWQYSKTSNIL